MALGVTHYGSRHAGTGSWLLVRITAVAIALGFLGAIIALAVMPELSYRAWHALFEGPVVRALLAFWFSAMTLHAYLGCDEILKDYVHPPGWRLVGMITIAAGLLALTGYGFAVFFG
ncbi:MAG TPA: succinate dehydrogenase, hydrophobic membrane anchor protein [Acidiferrobacter sp.]|nr:succinate dehydrogenase, hydrophobic membrane anchor protein [Acidiferrobacter sp.]